MKQINLSELLEEQVDERILCWLSWDGTYRLTYVKENGDEIELVKGLKDKMTIYEFLGVNGFA